MVMTAVPERERNGDSCDQGPAETRTDPEIARDTNDFVQNTGDTYDLNMNTYELNTKIQ